tara:strand:+ start:19528 stop:22470 length:2943 start_codon:yes stop_codon:yes gene_type:complete
MNHLDEAKLLSALLGVLKKESSKVRDGLLEELRTELQKDIEDQSGVKYLQLEEVDDLDKPIPIRVFRGDQGPRGITGAKGAKGDTGARGLRGTAGPQGTQGRVGPVGSTGPQGIRGQDGPTGPAGADGIDGATPDIKPVEDKLLKLLNDFKGSISAQVTRMAYAKGVVGSGGGSGEVNLSRLDDVDTSTLTDNFRLRYNATTEKFEFVDPNIVYGHLIPAANNLYDLGSPERQWRDLHLSGSTLYINDIAALQQDANTGNIVLSSNTQVATANGQIVPVAAQPDLDQYLQVANASVLIQSSFDSILDGAPAALDTLNELAAAISDDENFAVSIATNLSGKASNTYVNTQLSTKADTTTLNQYLQVANTFSESYNDLTNKPNLDVYASNTVVSLKANTADLSQYLQVANVASISDYNNLSNTPNLDVYAANSSVTSALSLKANVTDLNQYLQVANTNNFSGVYGDLTSRPNLDVYASNTALALKANSADLSQYLQVANTFSESYNDLTNKPNLDIYASNTALALKADSTDLAQYVQVANVNVLIADGINNLVDGAPAALDTLNELAAALGDDSNFVTTITTSLDDKSSNTYVNTQLSAKADTTALSQYLQVANTFSESYNDLTNKPNLDVYASNTALALKANTSDLDNYLQVANNFSGVYNDLSGIPNLDVYASNTALSLKANTTDLSQYLQAANNFSGVYNDLTSKPNLDIYAANSALALKADTTDLSDYLQVANAAFISGDYNELSNKPNLDIYAANSALSLKANTADLNQYVQVANNFSGVYSDLTSKPNLDVYASNSSVTSSLALKANTSDLNQYVQVANVNSLIQTSVDNLIDGAPGALDTLNELAAALGDDADFVTTITSSIDSKADTTLLSQYLQVANSTNFVTSNTLSTYLNVANTAGSGTSLVESKINNIVNLRSLRAGSNITLSENNGEIVIAATGTLSVSDSIDFGFVDNDFGSITDDADSDPQFDFGTL